MIPGDDPSGPAKPISGGPAQPNDIDEGDHGDIGRFAMASRAHVVIDAAAYFELAQSAMLRARQRIFMLGWDFDTRVRLGPGRRWWNRPNPARHPARLGAFVIWLVKRNHKLQVRVLKWNFGALKFVFRGTMIVDLIRWWWASGVDFKFDSAHPIGCSHHQKIVIIDDRFAVCGGIDMTTDRWDTPDHLDDDPGRTRPNGKPYGPWHDVTMVVEGDAARALGDLGRARWARAGGEPLEPCLPQPQTPWPGSLRAEFRDVEIGIARTVAKYGGEDEVREIEELFARQIAASRRFIYAESQYFASRRIAEAMALRLARPDPPEILLINPLNADGWLQQASMDTARVRLLHAVSEDDLQSRLHVYVPYTAGGTPIYIHAKLLIVDDELLRVGSANMNNRSMGLDTEADLYIDTARPPNNRGEVRAAIRRLRIRLLAEHCGVIDEVVAQGLEKHGSMADMINSLPASGLSSGKRLAPFHLRPLSDREKAVADSTLFDPETAGEMFEPMRRRRGLFRRGGVLRRPK
ncbi:MAG: phospholipase D-like domain-containing protein [Novosphingobium sp.]